MRTLSRALSRSISAALLIMLLGIYIEVPGPWRAITPAYFGLTEIAPRLYTDAPERALALRTLAERSRNRAEALFGTSGWQPNTVICTRPACTRTFGFNSAGLTIGYHLVLIAPSGINDEVMLHERIHVELHRRMSPLDLIRPRFPMWFDEGLATMLSRPPRVLSRGGEARAAWVRSAVTWGEWQSMAKRRPVTDLYNAAAALVGQIQDKVGRQGLFRLIDEVSAGGDFNTLYFKAIGG